MDKIKICLAIPGSHTDRKLWSGTHHTLLEELQKREDVELSLLEYNLDNYKIYRFFYKPIKKYIYTWNSNQDFIVRLISIHAIRKALKKNTKSVDYYLFPAMACPIPEQLIKKGKVAVYTDCLMCDLDKYRPYKLGKYLLTAFYRRNIVRDIRGCSLLFTQNDWSVKRFIQFCGIHERSVYNVHFGINVNFLNEPKDFENQLLLIVLRKGTENLKGLTLLLKSFPLVRKKYPNCRLAVVGTDVGKDIENVDCYYNQPRSITIELFKKCSLYVMPAKREPNGITYLEALANKAPIVGLNSFAVPEFSGYGKWGFIVGNNSPQVLADTICDALSNPERLRIMGEQGQLYVQEHFVWSNTVDKIVKIMKSTKIKNS